MLRVGGELEHIWGIGWYLEAQSFGYIVEHWRCTSAHCKVVRVNLRVSIVFMHV